MSVSVSSEKPEFKELLLQLQAAIANENTELSIQSIENSEKGVIAIFVNALTDDKQAIIYHELKQNYELLLKAIEDKYQAELRAKNCEIAMYRQAIDISEAVSESSTELETAANPSQKDESIAEVKYISIAEIKGIRSGRDTTPEDIVSARTIAESEEVESLRAIADKYKAELKYKEEEIAWCREQIAELRELNLMLAKQPLSINIIQEEK